jgi:glucoamylase
MIDQSNCASPSLKFQSLVSVFALCFSSACATSLKETSGAQTDLAAWTAAQERISWELLHLNISPEDPKFKGGPRPRHGIVVAALHKADPDYYFHWVRDSANVMRVVVEYQASRGGDEVKFHLKMKDYLELSQDLQSINSPFGMGEPRYTVEGNVDPLPWSRPQYDGPALRALAILRYLKDFEGRIPKVTRALALKVLKRDLDYTAAIHQERGFDIWEELKAENYHTQLVQYSALLQGKVYSKSQGLAEAQLLARLDDHWDPTRFFLRSQLAIERTDGYTKKQSDLDSAVLLAVIESDRLTGPHSVSDHRIMATVSALENLFRETYPLNRNSSLGLGYGRYRGDVYYGGNPWYLITAYFAQYYFRLALVISDHEFQVSSQNLEFVRDLVPDQTPQTLSEKLVWVRGSAAHNDLISACLRKADRILARLRSVTPRDGQLYEQFDKISGKPLSSRGIGWAHSAFIAASLERSKALEKVPARGMLNN